MIPCKPISLTPAFIWFCMTGVSPVPLEALQNGAREAREAVVKLVCDENRIGSGIALRSRSGDAFVLTNFHVVDGCDSVTVQVFEAVRFAPQATVYRVEESNDLALLSVPGWTERLPPVRLTQTLHIATGDRVMAIGHPLEGDWSVTHGRIARREGKYLVIDMTLGEGNSGGPLLNEKGDVVGVITEVDTLFGYALPADLVASVLRGWIEVVSGVRILVAEFNPARQVVNPMAALPLTTIFVEELENAIFDGDLQGKVEIETTGAVLRSEREALRAGEESNASIVIWGEYDATTVRTNLKILDPRGGVERFRSIKLGAERGIQVEQAIKNPESASYTYVRDSLPKEATFLALAVTGTMLSLLSQEEDALAAYGLAIDRSTGHAGIEALIYSYRARIHAFHRKDHDAALADYLRAIDRAPDDPAGYRNAAVMLNELGRHREAVDYVATTLLLNPEDYRALNTMGNTLLELGETAEGLSYLEQAVAVEPTFRLGWADLALQYGFLAGRGYSEAEFSAKAVTAAQTALALDPSMLSLQTLLGIAQWRADDHAAAEITFASVIRTAPRYAWAHYWLGRTYHQLERYPDAIGAYQEVIDISADEDSSLVDNAHVRLAGAYRALGDHQKALQHAQTAVDISPDYSQARAILGGVYLRMADTADHYLSDAVTELERAIELDSLNVWALQRLGKAYLLAGRTNDAVDVLERAYRADPEEESVAGILPTLYYVQGRYTDAVAVLRYNLQQSPNDADAHSLLGAIYHDALVEFDSAYAHLNEAYALESGDVSHAANLAESSFATGRYTDAYDLASTVAAARGVSVTLGLVMQFTMAAVQMFEHDDAQAEAEFGAFLTAYDAIPLGEDIGWSFDGTHHFVTSHEGVSEEPRRTVLAMIELLQQTKSESSIRTFIDNLPEGLRPAAEDVLGRP